jgi:hypothetical protein
MGRLTPQKLISIITSYYKLLERMYLPSEALKFPPPEGWPEFTPKIIEEIKKTKSEDVIYLMRFLPYIDETQTFDGLVDVEYSTRCIDCEYVQQRWMLSRVPCARVAFDTLFCL